VQAEEDRQQLLAQAELQQDRERIARDLHDGVMQAIYAVGLNLLATKNLIAESNAEATQSLDQSIQELRQVIDDIRRYVMSLSLDRLETSLPVLLDSLVNGLRETASLDVSLVIPEHVPALSEQQTLALYYIAREALTNVQKHAHAKRVRVCLDTGADAIALEVTDDGVGFDIAEVPGAEHMGLRNMRARAEAVGGSIEIERGAEGGTCLRCRLPLSD
jgi:signal transduction histidine kinase